MIYTLYYARKEKPEKARMNLIKTQQLYQPSLGKFHVTDLCHFVTFPGKIFQKILKGANNVTCLGSMILFDFFPNFFIEALS